MQTTQFLTPTGNSLLSNTILLSKNNLQSRFNFNLYSY